MRDYDDVYQLWRDTPGMGLNSLDDSRAGIERYLECNPASCFIAVKENRIVGAILCGHDGRRGYLYHIAVAAAERGQGVGSALLDAALAALDKQGINKASLVVFAHNAGGNRFWEKRGFAVREDLVYRDRVLTPSSRIDT